MWSLPSYLNMLMQLIKSQMFFSPCLQSTLKSQAHMGGGIRSEPTFYQNQYILKVILPLWLGNITETTGYQPNRLSSFLAGWVLIFHCNSAIEVDLPKWTILIPLPFFTGRFMEGNMRKSWLLKCKKLAVGLWVKDLLFFKNDTLKEMYPSFPLNFVTSGWLRGLELW